MYGIIGAYDVAKYGGTGADAHRTKLIRILVRVGVSRRSYADVVRSLDVIDSELRLLVAVRRAAVEEGGTAPSLHLIDGLLDERGAATADCREG